MNVSKAKTATIMNKFTIQQLQQMRESEDRVEFKAGEGGNVSYDGRGKTNPKDRRRCILGYVIALCNEGGGRLVIGMHDNYPHRVTGTRQAQDAIGQLESDIYRDTTIRPEIYPALLLLIHDIQHNRATTEQLNAFDLLALYRVSRGESIRNVDSDTLKKLLSQELLIETSDGIKLTPLYDEMKLRAGVTDKIEDKNVQVNDTVNVQVNDTIKISQLTERQRKIYEAIKTGTINAPNNVQVSVQVNIPNLAALFNVSEKTIRRDLYVLRDLNLIQYVGSDKTGHWEVTD